MTKKCVVKIIFSVAEVVALMLGSAAWPVFAEDDESAIVITVDCVNVQNSAAFVETK